MHAAIVLLALLCGLQVAQASAVLVMTSLLLVGLALVLLALWSSRPRWVTFVGADPRVWASVLIGLGLLVSVGFALSPIVEAPRSVVVPAVVLYVGAGVVALVRPTGRSGTVAFALVLVGFCVIGLLVISGEPSGIDVGVHMTHASRELVHGHNPYGGSVQDPYSAQQTREFYGAQFVSDGRITVGYPYLPALLVPDSAGYLLGDVRYAHLVVMLAVALLLRRLATEPTGLLLALAPIATPLSVPVLRNYYVEPEILLALTCLCLAVRAGRRGGAVASLAALLLTKQYLAAVVPALLPIGRAIGRRRVVLGVAVAALVLVPFVATDPHGFWRDAVEFQLGQPFRHDSISFIVALSDKVGRPSALVLGAAPFFAGWLVSALVAGRRLRGASPIALAVGLGLLATVLMSKQAFTNYYYLVELALVVGAVAWPADVARE